MAFSLGSIGSNPLQLQMQQMLGNLATAQLNGLNNMQSSPAVQTNLVAATQSTQVQSPQVQSTIVPMDLESTGEAANGDDSSAKRNDATTAKNNVNLNLMAANEMQMFGNLMGMASILPSPTGFPVSNWMPGLDPTLLNLQMMQQMNRMKEQAQQQQQQQQQQPSTSTAGTGGKDVIQCKSAHLYPPTAGPKPTTRDKPPGCRTVFVGGLPDNMTEPIIHEIFERCGEITTLRLSKKNFCHIRFAFESCVESAIFLSGYRVKIASSSDSANCGRLHVDYAQARDDQYEFECKQRQLQREQRHREKVEKDRLRPLSPPQIVHFSEIEATNLTEKIKNDETFMKACQILVTWLERGDCNKKNSNTIYTIIQSTNSQVRRIINEKAQYEQDLKDAKEKFRRQMYTINTQLNQIEKLFNAASHQKVWDHFTKAQRKNIDSWKKSLDVRFERQEEDVMEISDDEYSFSNKRARFDTDRLKEENDSLRCQLRASKNEIEHLRSESVDPEARDKLTKVLHETIRNLQSHLLANRQREMDLQGKVNGLEERLKKAKVKELLLKTKIAGASKRDSVSTKDSDNEENEEKLPEVQNEKVDDSDEDCVEVIEPSGEEEETIDCDDEVKEIKDVEEPTSSKQTLSQEIEAKLVSLSTAFLLIQPKGSGLTGLWSYLHQFSATTQPDQLVQVLRKYPKLFSENESGHWKFTGFNTTQIGDESKKKEENGETRVYNNNNH